MITLCNYLVCTCCGSCYSICPKECISMKPSKEGFIFPEINVDICIECGLCQNNCPILNPVKHYDNLKVCASWSLDERIHTTSSSGGIFSELSKWVFEKGGVVFGVVLNEDLDAIHVSAMSMVEIEPMKGSKYVQSIVGDTYKEVKEFLSAGRWVLYSGTPCQIAGLLKYLSPKECAKLITVDMVCHGVPSSLLFKEYVNKLEGIYPNVVRQSFQFRLLDKWTYKPSVISNGSRVEIAKKDNLFIKMFLSDFISRESCYRCLYAKVARVSDITIADFWDIGKTEPFNHDTEKGVSLCLVNTLKGNSLYNDLNNIFSEERQLEEAMAVNHQLYRQSYRPKWGRDIAYEYFLNHTIAQTNIRFFGKQIIKAGIKRVIKSLIRR